MLKRVPLFVGLSLLIFQLGCSTSKNSIESINENKPEWLNISASTDLSAVGNFSTGNGYVGNFSMNIRVRAQKLTDGEGYKVLQVQVKNGMSWARVYFRGVTEQGNIYKYDFGGQTYYFSL